jgi:hypothetical protein
MIVNYTQQGWEIITQRAHGVLAAQLAAHWAVKERPKRWTETLLAIAEHDDARTELESNDLLTPQGGPLNFDMQLFDPEHCRCLSNFSLSKSRYIALLTSMHMDFLYKKEESSNPLVKPFLQEQAKLQKQWLNDLHISQLEANRIYYLLEWCDACSLLLCRNEVQPEQRDIEVSQGPAKRKYKMQQLADGKLTIKPWPFEVNSFEVRVEKRLLQQLQFSSNDEFKACFVAAPVNEVVWQLVKP